MLKVAFVRGKYLNNFEGQNYIFPRKYGIQLTGISSLDPVHNNFPFPVIRLPSIVDYLGGRIVKAVANRLIGDSQILFGLENLKDKFDIFHTADPHYYYSYQLACLRAKKLIKKLIVTSWETIPFNNETVGRKKFIKYFVLKHADHFICYTEKAKKCLMEEGVEEKKIDVVRLGVDLNKFEDQNSKIKNKVKNNEDKSTILFVGRLVEEKGISDLYEVFKLLIENKDTLRVSSYAFGLQKSYKNGKDPLLNQPQTTLRVEKIRLKIVGDGPLKRVFTKKIKNDGFDMSVMIGVNTYEEMPEIYRDVDILVLPSKHSKTWEEQYGMVLIEAMAAGLPIVAYDSGAIGEIIGQSGILVEEGNIGELFISIKRLIEAPDLGIKLGKMGRRRAEKYFDSKKTAYKIKSIYEKQILS